MTGRRRYDAVTTAIPRTRPRRSADPALIEGVTIPLAWAAILAVALGMLVSTGTGILRLAIRTGWPWSVVPGVGVLVAVLTFAWRVAICEGDRRRLLLWDIEQATGEDLDGDGWAGPPPGRPQEPAKLIYVHNAGQGGANAQRAAADWRHWLREAYGETGTTWRAWDGKRLPSGRVVTRPLWDDYTGRLQRAGLARRDYPTGPLVLSGTYREALASFRETL